MKFFRLLLLLGIIGGIVMFVHNYRVEGMGDLKLIPRSSNSNVIGDLKAMIGSSLGSYGEPKYASDAPAPLVMPEGDFRTVAKVSTVPPAIRVATFNLHEFGREKVNSSQTMDYVTRLLRQFDVCALQEIDASRRDLLPKLVEHMNRTGRHYDYVSGPEIGPAGFTQRLAFVFDSDRVEADRKQTYTVADPGNEIAYEPLVAWFRTKGISPTSAWTFSLANVYIDPDNALRESAMIASIWDAIVRDGRGEDDVIMAGCFFASDTELAGFVPPRTTFALQATPTDIYARRQHCNILLRDSTTSEFNGNSGATDFLRLYNLTIAESEKISDQLPVWAEFSVSEDQGVL